MKIRKSLGLFFVAMICLLATFIFSKNVSAKEYGPSDIDRIYISSETPLNSLQKEYVSATLEVVSTDGTVQISDTSGYVKLRGNSTAKAEKKPFKIKFNKKQALLGMDTGKKWNVLANCFDKTLIRNKLGLDLAEKMGLPYTSQTRFVDVYYNDVLLGNYLVTEPVESGATRVDIEETETSKDFMIELERERNEEGVTYVYSKSGVRFAVDVPELPTQAQANDITEYINKMEAALKTYDINEFTKYIDLDSFVNYYIVSEIFKAVDFNYSSTRFFVKNGKMYAGPLWDIDLSSGNASPKFYTGYYKDGVSYKGLFCKEMKWYGYLLKSDAFVKKVNDRLAQMYPTIENMYKTNSVGNNQIDLLTGAYGKSFDRNYLAKANGGAGWSLTKRYSTCDNKLGLEFDPHPDTYKGNVEMLRTWLSNRVSYLQTEWKGIKNNYVEELRIEKESYREVHLEWYGYGFLNGYEIYAKAENGKYSLVKTIKDSGTWDCYIKIKPGIKYTFRVRGYMGEGANKLYTDYISATKKLALKTPKIKAKKVGKKYKLKWNKTLGAEGYVIYAGAKKSKLKAVATIKKGSTVKYTYKNKKGKKCYFAIKAYVTANGKKYYSK